MMLETLKNSVLSVCLLSIAVSVCLLICPDTALQKQVRFLISLLFIISLILPFRNISFLDSLEAIQQERSDTAMQEITEQSVENALKSVLAQNGITCSETDVSVHIDENHCISITDVSVTCDDFQNTVHLLKEILGEEVGIHVTEILE